MYDHIASAHEVNHMARLNLSLLKLSHMAIYMHICICMTTVRIRRLAHTHTYQLQADLKAKYQVQGGDETL